MPDFQSNFSKVGTAGSLQGVTPTAPAPTPPPAGLPAGAPTLNLGLGTVTIIVGGNVDIATTFPNAIIQRR